jgi:hypothetical protein
MIQVASKGIYAYLLYVEQVEMLYYISTLRMFGRDILKKVAVLGILHAHLFLI